MTKKMWVMIGAIVAAAAAVVVACVVLVEGKNETYRSILVYQVNGSATITRERVGEMKAYENLMLQSGDTIAVASGSSMRLKLDDDKYVLAEQDTLMRIVAEGNDENARTYIDLQRGSVTSEIQNKLKDGATYEVNTPNSIMAVRGTIFRVDVEIDENGNPNTKLEVFQGTVGVKTIMPDGTVSEEETRVEAGNELMVEGTPTTSEYSGEPVEIDYDSLPTIIKDYIDELAESGMKPDRNAEVKASNTQEEPEQREAERQQDSQEKQQEEKNVEKQQEAGQQETEQQNPSVKLEEEPSDSSKTPAKPQKNQPDSERQETEDSKKQESEEEQQQETEPQKTEPESQKTEPESQPQSSTPQTEPSSQPQSSTPQTEPSSQPQSEPQGGNSEEPKPQYYTVTFQYNGSTFGTQKVKKGEKAAEPKLSPTENGSWDYDFSKKVEKNLVIQWKEQ